MSINITYTFQPNTKAKSSEVNQNFVDLRTAVRGAHHQDTDGSKIVNADIHASAGIVDTKLATITTSGKVDDSALQTIDTPGKVSANAIPEDLGTSRIVDTLYIGDKSCFVDKNGANIRFTDPTAGSKTLTQLNVSKFGGTGADGALDLSAGNGNIDLGSSAVVVKNYTNLTVGNGYTLSFTNPNSAGTILIIKLTGNLTVAGTIDGDGDGASGGAVAYASASEVSGNIGTAGTGDLFVNTPYGGQATVGGNGAGGGGGGAGIYTGTAGTTSGSGAGGAGGSAQTNATATTTYIDNHRCYFVFAGSGGSSGAAVAELLNTATSGIGGNGGLTIIFEVLGNVDITGNINVRGGAGGNAIRTGTGNASAGGGGGGGGGSVLIMYNGTYSLSGTIAVTGGAGGTKIENGTKTAGNGGAGGNGIALAIKNNVFA